MNMDPITERSRQVTRRTLLRGGANGLGAMALGSLLGKEAHAGGGGVAGVPHFAPKAKRVIYLFMNGAPSQMDLFDFHPEMRARHGSELPESIRQGQRLTTMSSGQSSFPCVAPMFDFQ